MAIFSFRPPASNGRRRAPAGAASDWAETRPSGFADSDPLGAERPGAFATDPPLEESRAASPPSTSPGGRPTTPQAPAVPARPGSAGITAAFGEDAPSRPDPGFAKSLTARAQSDDLLGAGWYISSWDLMQGCDVVEGTPIDQLPPEWQRKRPRL